MSEEWNEAYSDSISDAFLWSAAMDRLSPITTVHDQVVSTGDLDDALARDLGLVPGSD